MARQKGLNEREQKYVMARADGKSQIESARLAGFSETTAVKSAFRIEARTLVHKSIEARQATVQAFLELHGCGLPLLNDSIKRGLREGNPATQRLFLEVFQIIGPERMRELAATWQEQLNSAIGHAATVFVAFIPTERRPEFEQKVAELRAQKLGEGRNGGQN